MRLKDHAVALRREASRLRGDAEKLDQAAGILEEALSNSTAKLSMLVTRSGQRRKQKVKTTLNRIAELLAEQGPLPRREIIKRGNIPTGSVSTYLKEANGFSRTDDGRWTLAEALEGKPTK